MYAHGCTVPAAYSGATYRMSMNNFYQYGNVTFSIFVSEFRTQIAIGGAGRAVVRRLSCAL